jgi:hypothetical protein
MPREDEAAKLELLLLEAVDRPTQVALVKLEAPVPGHRIDLPLPRLIDAVAQERLRDREVDRIRGLHSSGTQILFANERMADLTKAPLIVPI